MTRLLLSYGPRTLGTPGTPLLKPLLPTPVLPARIRDTVSKSRQTSVPRAWDSSECSLLATLFLWRCKFLTDPSVNGTYDIPRLRLICFGSHKCKGYKTKLPFYLGEACAGDLCLGNCHHYLWGCRNTWITDQYALVFLCNYDGNNGPTYLPTLDANNDDAC